MNIVWKPLNRRWARGFGLALGFGLAWGFRRWARGFSSKSTASRLRPLASSLQPTAAPTIQLSIGLFVVLFPSLLPGAQLLGRVIDQQTRQPLAARVYLQDDQQQSFFVRSANDAGEAVVYDKTNWINPRSVEKHTTVSAHPFLAALPPGIYTITVEHGKEYLPETRKIELRGPSADVTIELRRWSHLAKDGWYSTDTHIHRRLEELPTIMQAEDLHVAMPLTSWVTKAFLAPSDPTVPTNQPPEGLIRVGPEQVIWPRNTEYEIFSVGERNHTLGALFVLNHRSVLTQGVPPWGPMAQQARQEGALFDMDKLDWPVSMALPAATGAELYELANNHLWRTEFAFRDWNSLTPQFLQPPRGGRSGNERDWISYTLGMYYTLLNAGFPLQPTAGTASGVHPVPVGFSRVYVQLPPGTPFSYEAFLQHLREGHSFVTTGPMLRATVNLTPSGSTLRSASLETGWNVAGSILSEQPLAFAEIVVNGEVVDTIMPKNERTPEQAYRTEFQREVRVPSSGWLVVRAWEDRPDGRVRFAHTAPWWIQIDGHPLRISEPERDYLLQRVDDEIARSAEVVPPAARSEYEAARARFAGLETRPPERQDARPAANPQDLQRWMAIMRRHQFSREEMQRAMAITTEELGNALEATNNHPLMTTPSSGPLQLLPYPGGRHPRIGFLDGAIRPQRDTKLSVFTPWDPTSYVVVDLPEAIFTNLGLTYLAHTHVRTIWEDQGVTLPPLEWQTAEDGTMTLERQLPNGIRFGASAKPEGKQVAMELWLHNGTQQTLSAMRAQVCVMLKGATDFHSQTGTNKRLQGAAVAVHDVAKQRWIVTAWQPIQRAWQNPPVPCLHADPLLPDCPPEQTVRARGLLSFYEGNEIDAEMTRLEAVLGSTR